ncbi:MAG: TIGR02147 family protein [Chitinispirillaceae bacterium]|nr:TIGR02147 family protein [Chitinispirillaceae bacterium]
MQSIFDYLDYRLFLLDFYETQKKKHSFFSYRYMSGKIGLDAGYLVKILQGKLHLPEKYINTMCSFCKFSEKETAYFRTLINFNKAKSEAQIRIHFEKLMSFSSPGKQRIEKFQYEFYRKWYYTAIRSLIGIYRFSDDVESLSCMLTPPVSSREVKKAVELLVKLDMIKKDGDGYYTLSNAFVTTGESWQSLAIRDFQRETIRLAGESLDRHHKKDRDISTVSVAVNKKDLPELKLRITEFRDAILKLAENSDDPDCVYQLNVQLFPMADTTVEKS